MRAAAIDRFGGPEVLTLHTLPHWITVQQTPRQYPSDETP
jgi:hypothetical protein